jgi:acyl-coenzyme A thioesterase 9
MNRSRVLLSSLSRRSQLPVTRSIGAYGRWFSSSNEETEEPPNNLRFGSHLKNPIVHQLWTARGAAKAKAAIRYDNIDLETPRVPSQSTTSISYPFSSDEFLKETYRNPWGQIRFGKILEDLDALAGNIAFAHVQDPRLTIVTASVDRIRLTGQPSIDVDQHLSGKVTFVGTSSMEIRMQCCAEGEVGKDNYWMEAYFTFVATDLKTKRPIRIPPLQPETEFEQEQFKKGQQRAAIKKQARKASNANILDPDIERTAKALSKEAGPLLNMPSLANPHSILVQQTKLQSCEIAQPQTRNMANQIFGGFLMRRACELAYSTAYVFGGQRPIFYEVDQVQFSIPVNVGDLLNFHARVLYTVVKDTLPEFELTGFRAGGDTNDTNKSTQIPLVSVEVEAWVVDPEHASATLSNQFYFTFALPPSTDIRKVLPSNMEEARTMAIRMAADHAQEQDL